MQIMHAYFKFAFKNSTAYRIEWILGLINSIFQIFISCSIWKALYGHTEDINGIALSMVATNVIISLGLNNAFSFDDGMIQRKLGDGTLSNELLKPIDYRINLFITNMGNIAYKLLTNFLPTLFISLLFIGINKPDSILSFILFLISIVLGFLILWSLSLIVQLSSFWIMNVWSLSVLKTLVINVLAGTVLPLWFMPKPLLKIISLTPFDTLYFSPIKIYLGQMGKQAILSCYAKQFFWFLAFFLISNIMWERGKKRIVLQGG